VPVIETKGLTKYYGKGRGIVDVNITVEEGEIFGFIGPNGAGKSTTIRTLLNFIYPSSGSATILDKDCVKESTAIKSSIGYVPSEINYYKDMRVCDILNYAASFHSYVDFAYLGSLYEQFEVEPNKRVGELSLGNRKKVAILQALLHKPKLLILDEATIGLDPLMQIRLFEVISTVNKQGTTIFMSSHNLVEVEKHCHRVAIIREGQIIEIKKIEELVGKMCRRVTVKTKDNIGDELKALGVKNTNKTADTYVFIYEKSIDNLIKVISKYTLDDVLIEELSLENSFLHYYENGRDSK